MNNCGEWSATHYYTCGDTMVENQVFTPFFAGTIPNWGTFQPKRHGWFRETTNQVFYKTDWFAPEHLLYQFDLEPGDTCRVVRNYTPIASNVYHLRYPLFKVASFDSVLVDNAWAKRWVLTSDDPEIGNEIWLEGIGSTRGPVDITYCPGAQEAHLVCMSQGFNVLYESNDDWICTLLSNLPCDLPTSTTQPPSDAVSIYPNPFTTDLQVVAPNFPGLEIQLYNGLGQHCPVNQEFTTDGMLIHRGTLPPGWYHLAVWSAGQIAYRGNVLAR